MKAKITVEAVQDLKKEDVFVPGNVVTMKSSDGSVDEIVILVTDRAADGGEFDGLVLFHHKEKWQESTLQCRWDENCFVQFRGRVILDI